MRFARFRHQVLIAMGLPACWTAPAAEVKDTPVPRPPEPGVFVAAACPRDTIPETVCGAKDEAAPRCGPTAAVALETFEPRRLYVTVNDGEKHTFRRFMFDERATEAYRTELADGDGGGTPDLSQCCYSRCTPMVIAHVEDTQIGGYRTEARCIPRPPGGTSMPAEKAKACPAGVKLDGHIRPFHSAHTDQCCYAIPRRYEPVRGRAARVDGEARTADIAGGAAWSASFARRAGAQPQRADFAHDAAAHDARGPSVHAPRTVATDDGRSVRAPRAASSDVVPDLASLPDGVRAQLAAAWLASARMEHASIASFANLSLRLLALGAPPDLVAAAHVAALDEIEHARVAFQLASAYAGEPLQPARFADAARMSAAGDLASLALETFVDGCINETVAAFEAEQAGDVATDPAVAGALHQIAADEKRHAELAWAILAWCVRTSDRPLLPELRAALRDAAATSVPPAQDLAEHGVLGDAALADLRATVLRDVVEPCLDALA